MANAKAPDANVVYLTGVRLSFPHLVEPQVSKNTEGKDRVSYNVSLIMAPTDPGFAKFMGVVQAMAIEKWKEHAGQVLQMVNTDRKLRCYGNGAEIVNKTTFKVYDGYEGNVFITAGRDTRPQIILADGTPLDQANTMAYQQMTRAMYGGCYVNAAVKPWLQENKHGRGVRCDLIAVQFLRDGEAFGEGNVDVTGMFGAVAAQPAAATPAAPASMPPFLMPGTPAGMPSFLQPLK